MGVTNSFKKYLLDDWTFDFLECDDAETKNQVQFFETFGSLMTHLIISNCAFYNRDKFRKIIFEYAPKLEFLSLDGNRYFYSPVKTTDNIRLRYECNPEANWTELFKDALSPSKIRGNLEELQINLASNDVAAHFCVEWVELFRAFPNIQVSKKCMCISSSYFIAATGLKKCVSFYIERR